MRDFYPSLPMHPRLNKVFNKILMIIIIICWNLFHWNQYNLALDPTGGGGGGGGGVEYKYIIIAVRQIKRWTLKRNKNDIVRSQRAVTGGGCGFICPPRRWQGIFLHPFSLPGCSWES